MRKRNNAKEIARFCVILILVLVMVLCGLQILESTVFYRDQEQTETYVSKTITREGVDYYPRQDITVMLVMGIDQTGPVQDSGAYMNHGAADVVMLVIFDEKAEEYSILYLNRDTMLEMPVLGIGGRQAGTAYAQLALAHTYGSGLEDSCENVVKTVSDFLYGIRIDHYVSMNMDAIALLNDAVGGVTVTVEDDFSAVDPTITKGTVTLHSSQALNFLRTRKDVGDQLNLSRIQRQKTYMNSFSEIFRAKLEQDSSFALSTYEQVSPYIVTDCSGTVLTDMMDRFGQYTLKEIVSPEGENVLTEKYYEFHVEEALLDELILRLFYAPK